MADPQRKQQDRQQDSGQTPAGSDAAEVTQTPQDAAGVSAAQVKPAGDQSGKELKAAILHEPSRELHPDGDPEHLQDQTSVPTPYAPADRPPLATTRPDEPIVQSLVTGAGAHTPPDPDVYDAAGRIREGK